MANSRLSQFIDSNPSSTIYHSPTWSGVMKKTFGYGFHEITSNGNGNINGYMPLYHIKSPITGNRLVGGPFNVAEGPIFESEDAFWELMEKGTALMERLGCKGMALTSRQRLLFYRDFVESSSYVNSVLKLDTDYNKICSNFKKGCRWCVRKARKLGLDFRFSDEHSDLLAFYEIFAGTRKRLGVPVFPLALFENMKKAFKSDFKLAMVEYDRKAIASAIFLESKDTVTYAYAGSLKEYKKFGPVSLIIYEAIKHACEEGFKRLDFGVDHNSQKSLLRFKEQWEVVQRPVYSYYLGKVPNTTPESCATLRKIWSGLPLGVTRTLGPRIIRHFG